MYWSACTHVFRCVWMLCATAYMWRLEDNLAPVWGRVFVLFVCGVEQAVWPMSSGYFLDSPLAPHRSTAPGFFMWVLGIWTQVLSFVHSKWLILHFPACLPLLPWDEVLLCSPRAFLCLPHRSFTENEVSLFLSCCAALGRSAICHQTTLEMWACLSWSWPQRTL